MDFKSLQTQNTTYTSSPSFKTKIKGVAEGYILLSNANNGKLIALFDPKQNYICVSHNDKWYSFNVERKDLLKDFLESKIPLSLAVKSNSCKIKEYVKTGENEYKFTKDLCLPPKIYDIKLHYNFIKSFN